MTWRSFIEYVEMRERGDTDVTYRAYDLTHWAFDLGKTYQMLELGPSNMFGLPVASMASLMFSDVRTKLQNHGIELSTQKVARYLHEWYHWRRFTTGKIRRLPYRKTPLD